MFTLALAESIISYNHCRLDAVSCKSSALEQQRDITGTEMNTLSLPGHHSGVFSVDVNRFTAVQPPHNLLRNSRNSLTWLVRLPLAPPVYCVPIARAMRSIVLIYFVFLKSNSEFSESLDSRYLHIADTRLRFAR